MDGIPVSHQANGAPGRRLRRDVPDGQARGAPREASVCDKGAGLAQPLRFQVAGGIEHLLHTGAATGPFIADHHNGTRLHTVIEDVVHRGLLAFAHMGPALEHKYRVVDAGGLDDTAIGGDVAIEHREAAFETVGVLDGPNATVGPVGVEARPAGVLAERHLGGDAGRTGLEEVADGLRGGAGQIPGIQGFPECRGVNGGQVHVEQPCAVELTENSHDPAGTVDIFDMVVRGVGRHLAQLGNLAGQAIDIRHGEIHLGFLGRCQQVKNGVGGAPHGDIHDHGVLKGLEGGDGAGQDGVVILLVVPLGELDNQLSGPLEQRLAVRMGGHNSAIARQRKPQCLCEAIHRIGRKHTGTGAAGRAGGALVFFRDFVADGGIRGYHHGVDQVEFVLRQLGFARFHRPAGDEHHRDVEAHCRHQHAGGDLVAVGDTHQGVCAVCIHHVLHGIGNDVPRGQGVEHAVVTHGDAVIHRDGVELATHAAGLGDLFRHQLAEVLKMNVARHELGKGVGDSDDRLVKVLVLETRGTPQGTGPSHVAALGGGV